MAFTDKEQAREYQRQYYLANKERITLREQAYKAAHRDEHKTRAAQFYLRNRARLLAQTTLYAQAHREQKRVYRRQHYLKNKAKNNAATAAYYLAHKGRHGKLTAAWKQAHPEDVCEYSKRRRARTTGVLVTLTLAQWRAIKLAYRNCCAYCGRKMERLTQDHVLPLAKGGGHTCDNVVPACQSCNSRKFTNPPPTLPAKRLML